MSIKKQRLNELWRLSAIQGGRKIEIPANTSGDKEEYIQQLNQFMEESAEQNKFLEAETARQKIEELKESLNCNKQGELNEKHQTEQQDIDQAHQEECQQFKQFWTEKMEEFKKEGEELMAELQSRHIEEQSLYKQELEQGLPDKQKDSQKLLQLKQQRDILSKQKQYIDAHLVHVEILKIHEEEQTAFQKERQAKIQVQVNHLLHKQQQEFNALQAKIQKGTNEQETRMKLEEERLMMKYNVVKKDITNRQQTEQNFLKKSQKNPGMNNSKYFSQSRMSQSRMSQSRSRLV